VWPLDRHSCYHLFSAYSSSVAGSSGFHVRNDYTLFASPRNNDVTARSFSGQYVAWQRLASACRWSLHVTRCSCQSACAPAATVSHGTCLSERAVEIGGRSGILSPAEKRHEGLRSTGSGMWFRDPGRLRIKLCCLVLF